MLIKVTWYSTARVWHICTLIQMSAVGCLSLGSFLRILSVFHATSTSLIRNQPTHILWYRNESYSTRRAYILALRVQRVNQDTHYQYFGLWGGWQSWSWQADDLNNRRCQSLLFSLHNWRWPLQLANLWRFIWRFSFNLFICPTEECFIMWRAKCTVTVD